jgi:hypothetical protein
MKAYVHYPSLVQHSIVLKSVMKNPNTDKRQSFCFDKNFISNYLKNQDHE